MLEIFLWTIGILSIVSMILNHILDLYYVSPKLARTCHFLIYIVAIITLVTAFVYRENVMVLKISILAFVISSIKSFLYHKKYKSALRYCEDENEYEEENENIDEEE